MLHPPTLTTDRLILRPFSFSDAQKVREFASAPEIYQNTLNIPHPYEEGMAEKWIATHALDFYEGRGVTLAITLDGGENLIGAIGLVADVGHRRAELGYWIGLPYWGKGYCTEAAKELVRYGFDILKYHRIIAHHLEMNPASGRVMEKIGMKREGVLRDHVLKDGVYHTIVMYGILCDGM